MIDCECSFPFGQLPIQHNRRIPRPIEGEVPAKTQDAVTNRTSFTRIAECPHLRMKDTTGFPRLHIVDAWLKKSEQLRMFSLWQAYLPALAKDREAMPVLPQGFKNSKRVRLVLALPLPSKRESERKHQRAN